MVVQMLDERCESAIDKTNPDEIEINIDAIDPGTFDAVDKFVKDCLPEGETPKKSKKKKKRQEDVAGGKAKKVKGT
jgi:hypothetical protein